MRHLRWTLSVVAVVCLAAVGAAEAAERRVVHVVVALCDNVHQGIVPVPARIGNGDDPDNNLYWGAAFGVRTFFSRSADWTLVTRQRNVSTFVLERLVFKRRGQEVFLVADAYRGAEIKRGISDFLAYAAGQRVVTIEGVEAGGRADLVAFVGHDGLMDFTLDDSPAGLPGRTRDVVVLCCASKQYFAQPLRQASASPLLWTTGLMAPEAYVLKAAVDGWIAREGGEAVRERAATAYNQYQKCGLKAARRLFATGW